MEREEAAYIARHGRRVAVLIESDNWIPKQNDFYTWDGNLAKLRKVDARAVAEPVILPAERLRLSSACQYSDFPSDKDIIANMPERANAYSLGEKLELSLSDFHLQAVQYFRIPRKELIKELEIEKSSKKAKK
jgi:hypothetical protein